MERVRSWCWLILTAFGMQSVGGYSGEHQDRLNVLFVAIDDLRCEMGCWGHDYMVTPNLDRIAAGGVRFTKAYCQQALCHPSRNSVMSGLRPDALRGRATASFYRTLMVASSVITSCSAPIARARMARGTLYSRRK